MRVPAIHIKPLVDTLHLVSFPAHQLTLASLQIWAPYKLG